MSSVTSLLLTCQREHFRCGETKVFWNLITEITSSNDSIIFGGLERFLLYSCPLIGLFNSVNNFCLFLFIIFFFKWKYVSAVIMSWSTILNLLLLFPGHLQICEVALSLNLVLPSHLGTNQSSNCATSELKKCCAAQGTGLSRGEDVHHLCGYWT